MCHDVEVIYVRHGLKPSAFLLCFVHGGYRAIAFELRSVHGCHYAVAFELCSVIGYFNAEVWGICCNMLSVFCCSDGSRCASVSHWTARGVRGSIPPGAEPSGQQAGSKPTWGQDAWEGQLQDAFLLSASVKVISESLRQHDSALIRFSCTNPACSER